MKGLRANRHGLRSLKFDSPTQLAVFEPEQRRRRQRQSLPKPAGSRVVGQAIASAKPIAAGQRKVHGGAQCARRAEQGKSNAQSVTIERIRFGELVGWRSEFRA